MDSIMLSTFIENEEAKRTLTRYLAGGRLPHAILLEGDTGLGKKAFAFLIAAGIECTAEPMLRPCGVCRDCKKVISHSHPDVQLISGGGGSRSFHIESIRQIRSRLYTAPNEGRATIYILADAHNMTQQAQNALLKILEEPPKGTFFILTAQNREHLLETILSRVTPIRLKPVSPEGVYAVLSTRFPEETPERINRVASLSGGNIGKAIGLMEDAAAFSFLENCTQILQSLILPDSYTLLNLLSHYEKDRLGITKLIDRLCVLVRDVMVSRSANLPLLSGERDTVTALANRISPLQCQKLLSVLADARARLEQNASGALLTTWLCCEMRAAIGLF